MSSKNSTNRPKGFNAEAIRWARDEWAGQLPTRLRAELLDLATRTNHGSPTCFQKQQTLANAHGISRQTMSNDLKKLRDLGLVSWQRRKNTSNLYTLHLDVKPSGCKAYVYNQDVKHTFTTGCKDQIDIKKNSPVEVPIEIKVDDVDHRTTPSASASEGEHKSKTTDLTDSLRRSQDDSAPPADSYTWMKNDYAAVNAFVWHDLYGPMTAGRHIVRVSPIGKQEPLADKTKQLLEASRLVNAYATNCNKGAPKARVAFWHSIGRLFYPTLPRFAPNHDLKRQSKILHRVFDDLGPPACYVIAHTMANWPDGKGPSLTDFVEQSDNFYAAWCEMFGKVVLPGTKSAYELAAKRYMPHRRADFERLWRDIVLQVVAENVPTAPEYGQAA